MKESNFLSLVVPAYKQEKTIVKDLATLNNVLASLNTNYEIIVVVDGFLDKTFEEIKKIKNKNIKVYGYQDNKGKGYAIKYGVEKAVGDVVGFIDAGMDLDPVAISMLLNHMEWYDADIIVGSKLHPVSQVDYPLVRRILSWGYRTFTHIIFGFGIKDTQTGIKLFKRKVVKDVFPRLLVDKFAFDIEILALAYALGYKRIYEAPIKLSFKGNSSISSTNLWKIIIKMFIDTLAVFYRVRVIKFYRKKNKKNWKKFE
ncbi:MAG: glycosyltransferase [Patescibacteria group bacterium]